MRRGRRAGLLIRTPAIATLFFLGGVSIGPLTPPSYLIMNFEYNPAIDKQCWKRVNAKTHIFGTTKKTQKYPLNNETIKKLKKTWTPLVEKKFQKGVYQIFGVHIPKNFICYINSTSYSMDLADGISISTTTEAPIKTICHEINHYLFRKSIYKKIFFPRKNIEEAKEIFTIINNIYFQDIIEVQDAGWKIFWKERYNFLANWIKKKQTTYKTNKKSAN